MPIPAAAELHTYATFHEQIATAVAGLRPEELRAIPVEGEWSIQQVLIHLADSEVVGYERLRRIIAEDRPALQPYDEEAWGRNLHYHQQDPQLAQALFAVLRQASAALLHQLPAESWERIGLHVENGEMSLYTAFQTYLNHGIVHLRQLEHTRHQLALSPDQQ